MNTKKTLLKKENKAAPKGWFEPRKAGQGKLKFSIIPIQLLLDPRVNKTGLQTFAALATHADKYTGLCGTFVAGRYRTPSYARLAAMVGLQRRSIQDGVANLVAAGWIVRKKRRHDNTLVMWIGMPEDLELVNEYGEFKDLPNSWSSAEVFVEDKSEDDTIQEMLDAAPRGEDGSIDMDILLSMPIMKGNPRNMKTVKNKLGLEASSENLEGAVADIAPAPTYADCVADILRFGETGVRLYTENAVRQHKLSYEMNVEEFRVNFHTEF